MMRFEETILKNDLFNKKDNLLLAISGGIDSVVLAWLLKEGNYNFSLAHCNFNLRGSDSKNDEKFCRELAKKLDVNIFVKQFDTKLYSKKNKVSIQMAARDLRYSWFKKLIREEKLDKLLTAHHANDVVETVLLNLFRGTGIKGLKGIPIKNGKTVRPLLHCSKEEIEAYARTNKIKFRKDKSNEEEKYGRNFLRLKVIPLLKKLNPALEQTFVKNSSRFIEEGAIVNEYLQKKEKELLHLHKGNVVIKRQSLAKEKYASTLLNHLLKPFNFKETQRSNIERVLHTNSTETKYFYSDTHRLHIEREELILSEFRLPEPEIKINSLKELKNSTMIKFSKQKEFHLPKRNELLLREDQLHFPLSLRAGKTGEKFKPFGMKGFKLLSDFYKDEKISTNEKEKCKLLVNGNGQIIWVIGYRSDERYRINPTDKNLIKLSLLE
ncbi:MAG: tRNA lysidine(34) synthetase TilS [Bacteroidetes bacterium]|nr:tRNA lysidine(34) synthetase TilS [Bacteroidota bacterium]